MNSLHLLDGLLTIVHLLIIGFNLFGWVWKKTRRLHFIFAMITPGSWFILGIWYGMGYCPVTDWQWNIKEKLGETNLPASFVEYYAERITGYDFTTSFIDLTTLVTFLSAIILSLYFNLFQRPEKEKKKIS